MPGVLVLSPSVLEDWWRDTLGRAPTHNASSLLGLKAGSRSHEAHFPAAVIVQPAASRPPLVFFGAHSASSGSSTGSHSIVFTSFVGGEDAIPHARLLQKVQSARAAAAANLATGALAPTGKPRFPRADGVDSYLGSIVNDYVPRVAQAKGPKYLSRQGSSTQRSSTQGGTDYRAMMGLMGLKDQLMKPKSNMEALNDLSSQYASQVASQVPFVKDFQAHLEELKGAPMHIAAAMYPGLKSIIGATILTPADAVGTEIINFVGKRLGKSAVKLMMKSAGFYKQLIMWGMGQAVKLGESKSCFSLQQWLLS